MDVFRLRPKQAGPRRLGFTVQVGFMGVAAAIFVHPTGRTLHLAATGLSCVPELIPERRLNSEGILG